MSPNQDADGPPRPEPDREASPRKEESARIPDSARDEQAGAAEAFARIMRQAAPLLAASWALTAAVLLGAGGGWLLDKKLGTAPWLLLAGCVAGVAVGLYQLARVVLRPGGKGGE